jgi:cytoskeletal protein RodZ
MEVAMNEATTKEEKSKKSTFWSRFVTFLGMGGFMVIIVVVVVVIGLISYWTR